MASLFDASMRKPVRKLYITRSGGRYQPDDVAVAFALSLRIYDSADHLRRLARRLVDKVCREHQPSMKLLYREQGDEKVFEVALRIINRVCDLQGYVPGRRFVRNGGDDGSDAAAA